MRRYAILAPGTFGTRSAKTAHGVIAYGRDATVAVIDPDHAGKRVHDVVPYLSSDAPVVESLAAALALDPTALLVGVAPPGGALPLDWRSEIVAALEAGLEVVSGLHQAFNDDPEFVAAAERGKTSIWDVRIPPPVPLFSGKAYDLEARVALLVGTDCAVGKMTAALELDRAARARGVRSAFAATGQTGIMIAGAGIAIDRVISDFASGAAESLVLDAAQAGAELVFVEGQGGINHPAFAPVTLALVYGCAPDSLILVHQATRTRIEDYDTPVLPYPVAVRAYEALCALVKPARVAGIALNTSGLDERAARAAIDEAKAVTNLPCDDLVRFGAGAFFEAIAPALARKGRPLSDRVRAQTGAALA